MWHPSRKLSPLIWLKLVETRKDIPSKEGFIERQVSSGMNDEEAIARLKSFYPLYSKQLRMLLSWVFLVLSLVFVIFSGWLDYEALIKNMDVRDWFPRSGAILVAISIWSEYEPTRLNSAPTNIPGYTTTETYSKVLKFFSVLGVWLAIFGTIVWAYGDVLIEALLCVHQ